jgi:hypothetical protein
MRKRPKQPSVTEQPLPFHYDEETAEESLTALGGMPCGRFGANAAWLRLAVLTYNLLSVLKRLALPPELLRARPKRLRFLILDPKPENRTNRDWSYRRRLRSSNDRRGGSTCRRGDTPKSRSSPR